MRMEGEALMDALEIGDSSARQIAELQNLIETLDLEEESLGSSALGDAMEKLREGAVKVSFVGQVKAGKSSLIMVCLAPNPAPILGLITRIFCLGISRALAAIRRIWKGTWVEVTMVSLPL